MVWTCRAQYRLDCRSTQAECGCTEKIWQAKEIMGWSAWEWQKEARYGFCWPSKSFWVERTPSRKTCQKSQPSVEENRALKWIWWWWWGSEADAQADLRLCCLHMAKTGFHMTWLICEQQRCRSACTSGLSFEHLCCLLPGYLKVLYEIEKWF